MDWSGLPASPGRASGPARVIRTPEEFDRLQPGDVLIAPVTTPAWTPLFARAAAVVTDTGSPLAHASLAAREYGIPAVVGTGNATARLQDGQMVLVDGNTGLVEVLSMTASTDPQQRLTPEQWSFLQEALATSSALSAADHLGVLARLDAGPADSITLARDCAISERGARLLLAALSSLGLIEEDFGWLVPHCSSRAWPN